MLVKFALHEYVSAFYTDFICVTLRAIELVPEAGITHMPPLTIRLAPCLLQKLEPRCSALK